MIIAHIRSNFLEAFFPRQTEWFAALVVFFTGIMLTINEDLMSTATSLGNGRNYQLLLQIATQSTWATVLTVCGSLRLIILLVNGAWKKSPWGRAISAFLCCFFWAQIMLSFMSTFGFGFVMACGWLGADMVNVMRAMRDARTVDDALREREKGSGLE